MRRKIAAILCIVIVSGCSLHTKNIKPAAPFNFGFLYEMAKYAEAAYQDDASIRALTRPAFPDVYIQTITTTNNKYFIATSSATRLQRIAIAGTANIENVLVDADFTQNFVPEVKIALHRGFARAARLIYDDVKPRLRPGYRLQIAGHSLGGAEALILGMMLKTTGTPAEMIITFGQPRVTDAAGADAFKDLPLTRVVNQDDIIPVVPLDPYRQIGPELVLFPGTTFSLVQERPFNPQEVIAAWKALQNHQAPAEFPEHYIANYLKNLDSKIAASQLIPYPKP